MLLANLNAKTEDLNHPRSTDRSTVTVSAITMLLKISDETIDGEDKQLAE